MSDSDHDRPDSLLTSSQRDRLSSRYDQSGRYNAKHRQRIRTRVSNGTQDLGILFQHLEERDIEQVFQAGDDEIKSVLNIINTLENRFENISILTHEIEKIKEEIRSEHRRLADLEARKANMSRLTTDELVLESQTNKIEAAKSDIENNQERLKNKKSKLVDKLQFDIIDLTQSIDDLNLERLPTPIADEIQILREILSQFDDPYDSGHSVNEYLERYDPHAPDPSFNNYIKQHGELQEDLADSINTLSSGIDDALTTTRLDPDRRKDIIDAISFFLRTVDVCSGSIEEILEQAISRTYSEQRPSKVVGSVSVNIDSDDKELAAERGKRKLANSNSEYLSAAELRAIAETDYTQLSSLMTSGLNVEQLVRSNIDQIIPVTEVVEQPMKQGTHRVPDLLVKAEDGYPVVIEIKRQFSREALEEVEMLIEEYGGEENVGGLLISLKNEAEIPHLQVQGALPDNLRFKKSISIPELRRNND